MHYYQWSPKDYMSKTSFLEPMEDLAYRRMLDYCYLNEVPLPEDIEEVALLISMRSHTDCIAFVLRRFFELTPDGYVNDRVFRELAEYHGKSAKAKASADARWEKHRKKQSHKEDKPKKGSEGNADVMRTHSEVNADAVQTDCEGNANYKLITNNYELGTNNQEDNTSVLEVFDFWKEVFKKNDRTKLEGVREKKIKARLKEGYSVDEIKTAILNISKSDYHVQNGYTDIELICRDQIKLDKNIAMSNAPQNSNYSAAGKTQAEMDKWNNFLSDRDQQFDAIDVTPDQQFFIEGK